MQGKFNPSFAAYLAMGLVVLMMALSNGVNIAHADDAAQPESCVVLLHGLARTYRSMESMATALEAAGYRVFNMDYASRQYPIEQLALQVIPEALDQCRSARCSTIHFVTHSMGGILLRYYLSEHAIAEMGRVVMLSPPNQGSEAADYLRDSKLYQWFNGPAGAQLITGPQGITATLGPVDYPVGVITGNEHSFFDWWLSDIIPGEDDGKVSVERAAVSGMTDFLVVPYAHPFIMDEKEVIEQTLHFLKHNRFHHISER